MLDKDIKDFVFVCNILLVTGIPSNLPVLASNRRTKVLPLVKMFNFL